VLQPTSVENSAVKSNYHFLYFDPDHPTSGLTVTGLPRVYCTSVSYTELSEALAALETSYIWPTEAYHYLPVVPAPVYAMRHRLVDSSQSLMRESLPDDSRYYNTHQHNINPQCSYPFYRQATSGHKEKSYKAALFCPVGTDQITSDHLQYSNKLQFKKILRFQKIFTLGYNTV
jgi:hypothetical protein